VNGHDRWVVARAENPSHQPGDAIFHRHNSAGRYIDTIRLANGGHPSQFAVKWNGDDLKVLLRWNSTPRWVVYRSRTRRVADARIRLQATPGITHAHVALSESRGWMVARKQRRDGREEYALYRRRVGGSEQLAHFVRDKPAIHQGFATDGRYIYVMYGPANRRPFIQRLDRQGRLKGTLDVGRFCVCSYGSREVEGLGWRKGHLIMANREGGANRVVTVGEIHYARWGL
jgi:hypothetical protein